MLFSESYTGKIPASKIQKENFAVVDFQMLLNCLIFDPGAKNPISQSIGDPQGLAHQTTFSVDSGGLVEYFMIILVFPVAGRGFFKQWIEWSETQP